MRCSSSRRRCAASSRSRCLHWSIPQFFLALAIANALVAIYIFTLVPEFLMRFLSWLLVKSLYRLRVDGIDATFPTKARRSWSATTSATWTR